MISFEDKNNTFYYETTVQAWKTILKILRKVNQNNVENAEKFNHLKMH